MQKITRVTIFLKCIDFVELSLIKSMYISFSFISFDCAIIFLFLDIVFISLSMMLQNICLNNLKEILNSSRKQTSINVFNICLIMLIESDCSLMICVNFLNFFKVLTTSTELNLICFVFLYFTIREFELMLKRISFIATSALRTLIDIESLLKTTLFVKFTAFE